MQADPKRTADISLATCVALYGYILVAVLKQTDVGLVLPSSVFDLGGLLEKVKSGIPGGAFVAPVLGTQIPLRWFYTGSPLVLLMLHWFLISHPTLLSSASRSLRLVVIWISPLTLALIRWRFAPYVSARPEPPPIGMVIEQVQILALAVDTMLCIAATLRPAIDAMQVPGDEPRQRALIMRAFYGAGVIWLSILIGSVEPWPYLGWATVAMLILGAWVFGAPRTGFGTYVPPALAPTINEEVSMFGRLLFSLVFFVLATLPFFARALDFTGESLVVQQPSDAQIAALLPDRSEIRKAMAGNEAQGLINIANDVERARQAAWVVYSRGIDLSHWRFPGAHFDHATMVKITLTSALLRNASFDSADLFRADLRGAELAGSSLRNSSMIEVQAQAVVPTGAGAVPSGSQKAAEKPGDIDPTAKTCNGKRTNFSGADFSGADLSNANLECARMQRVKMDNHTKLENTNLQNADFCQADLHNVDLSKAVGAQSASFDLANLQDAKLPPIMKDAYMRKAEIDGAMAGSQTSTTAPETVDFTGAHLNYAVQTPDRDKDHPPAVCPALALPK